MHEALKTYVARLVERIGLPEVSYNLYHCASVLAKAPKSRQVSDAMHAAQAAAQQYPDTPVPTGIRNAPTKLMKDLGYGQANKWQAGFKHPDGFLQGNKWSISNYCIFLI